MTHSGINIYAALFPQLELYELLSQTVSYQLHDMVHSGPCSLLLSAGKGKHHFQVIFASLPLLLAYFLKKTSDLTSLISVAADYFTK